MDSNVFSASLRNLLLLISIIFWASSLSSSHSLKLTFLSLEVELCLELQTDLTDRWVEFLSSFFNYLWISLTMFSRYDNLLDTSTLSGLDSSLAFLSLLRLEDIGVLADFLAVLDFVDKSESMWTEEWIDVFVLLRFLLLLLCLDWVSFYNLDALSFLFPEVLICALYNLDALSFLFTDVLMFVELVFICLDELFEHWLFKPSYDLLPEFVNLVLP